VVRSGPPEAPARQVKDAGGVVRVHTPPFGHDGVERCDAMIEGGCPRDEQNPRRRRQRGCQPRTPATVFDDAAVDVLTGNDSRDWFFANLSGGVLDSITDLLTTAPPKRPHLS